MASGVCAREKIVKLAEVASTRFALIHVQLARLPVSLIAILILRTKPLVLQVPVLPSWKVSMEVLTAQVKYWLPTVQRGASRGWGRFDADCENGVV